MSRPVSDTTSTLNGDRFLFLEEWIPLAESLDEEQENTLWTDITSRVEGISMFSHLAFLAVVDVTETPERLQIMLFRPIYISTLLEICNERTSANASDIVGLFGQDPFLEETYDGSPSPPRRITGIITHLAIKAGAYVSRLLTARTTPHAPPVHDSGRSNGKVLIEDEADLIGIKETLEVMFCSYPGRAAEHFADTAPHVRSAIHLECSSSVLDLIPEAVSLKLVGSIHADITAQDSQLSNRTIVRLHSPLVRCYDSSSDGESSDLPR